MLRGSGVQNNVLYHSGESDMDTVKLALRAETRQQRAFSQRTGGSDTQVGREAVKNSRVESGSSVGEGGWMLEPGFGGLRWLQPSSATVRTKTPLLSRLFPVTPGEHSSSSPPKH